MAVIEVNVVPVGTATASMSSYIAGCCNILKEEKGLKYQVTPMSTVIEGKLDHVLEVVKKMHQVPFNDGVQRVLTSITIDERRDKEESMQEMVSSVV